MRLIQLIKSLDSYHTDSNLKDFEVRGISCDSKLVGENFIFVAIRGIDEDGHNFIEEAIARGAEAVLIQYQVSGIRYQDKINLIKVEDTRRALARLAAEFYGNPSSKIKVVGITGTNGKTTVTYLIEAILKEANFNPAVIGTINYRFKDKVLSAKNTTPGPLELHCILSEMLKGGLDYAIMEVSSHALDQHRTEGINFYSAIFTNLTPEHLDYHKTLENYFQAKLKLFKNIGLNSFVIINNDDEYGRILKGLTPAEVITYGVENQADVMAGEIKFDIWHTEFLLTTIKGQTNFRTSLIGRHNVYNILAAVSWALREGLELPTIKSAIEKFSYVPGRLERVDAPLDFLIFLDYAHTEDALKNVISTLRQLASGRIIVVFGCGGQRDKTKRPKMGYVVSELADYAIITTDNPRSEDPEAIIEDIKKGIKKENFCVMLEREEAIRKSLSLAKSGDIILVAGKGHEDYQILKDRVIPFADRRVIEKCLKSMNY
ncbi:MAG: UDP-N-acetylmuramoyl-L-alanyl-D-glutamate--2,6-diaminopimelate ligase [Candidatus Omnitrophica bacterium]|nr:UDP-N-acetylmuramoyl-L-alanyl-D-glutamate--2,6-diaminopimelate ligase [Candidatus Omnitrophota bacterium]MBU4473587.1 UDP-N-acetylmuramoyl-L-alanyl-D-glutamate--2,6-diaminopimelate ligase [Candidatus Omnitrophota bacterium]MCG2706304.1 UDP-N-acetylmuramoyl-L-alanyl-D-glutamate--2,6-diaminopimelate ligase [Candidatus Omnitrophota bacterium]